MSTLRNRLITKAVTTFGLNSEDEYRKASRFVDHMLAGCNEARRAVLVDEVFATKYDRMQHDLFEAREIVARLRRYGEGWEDDFREQMQGQHGEFVEKTIQQMRDEYLQPGDMSEREEEVTA